jgi:polysaccharide chain length determinant protein (PEP-CTERM system associated)
MEDEPILDYREILALLRRRRSLIAITALVVVMAAVAAAIGLPSIYRSSATILVQEQEIPPELVRSTITSFADERIQVISQQVMTRAVLLDMIERHGLYERYRKRDSTEQILDRMRKDIVLSTVNADVSDRSSGRRVNATIAFRVSYDAPRPEQAQKVVDELVSLYLSENAKVRQRSVAETTAFLAEEADRLAGQIKEIEGKLAAFERRHAGRLPDTAEVNQQLAERTEAELLRVERDIGMLQDRKSYLENQLTLVSPNLPMPTVAETERALSPEDRLRALEAEYARASTKYSPEHPDIRRMKREIDALAASPGIKATKSETRPDAPRAPSNPAYVAIATQLETTKRELVSMLTQREDLRAKRRQYDARMLEIPDIKREYRDITRDYENAQTRYREVRAKQMQAEVAQELERDRKAERFSLGEPANLPQRPVSPNRPVILLVGLFASLGSGLGLGWARDKLDPSIKGPWELQRLTQGPLLMAIPYIETQSEQSALRSHTRGVWAAGGVLTVVFLVLVHFFLRPLPDIWDAVLRKIVFW